MAPAEDSADKSAVKIDDESSIPIPQRPPTPERLDRRVRRLDGLLVLVVLLFAFLMAFFPAYNGDFFFHAATGRLIAQGKYQVGVDPFAFTTQGAVWINHNWLYDLVVFLIYNSSAAGGTILIVLKALIVAALAYVMLRAASEPGRSLWIPAACVGLAVFALSPRVFLQPAVISFFFLGVTLWLLYLPRKLRGRSRRPFLSYWFIPPLCLLWVNVDEWFLLGPAMVALYLIGEGFQDWFGPAKADAPAPGERLALRLVLVVSVALCFVNPHHFRAFTLPAQLGVGAAADALHRDPNYRVLFLTPFEGLYFHPYLGLSAAGLAYFPLALLGVVSFAAAQWVGRWRWERVLLWVAFFALSLWHARAIPFFAVVGGPIAALNFLDFAAVVARSGDHATTAAPQRGAWALGGRILTLLAGLILLVLSWPGWLQALPWELRRGGWDVVPNAALKQMAKQINTWQKNGLVKPNSRWFNLAPEALDYLAWYCPGQRAFIGNQRLSLYSRETAEDFMALRKSLAREGGDAASADPKWRKILRANHTDLLIWYEARPFPPSFASPLPTLLSAPKEWHLLYVNGRAAAFGWKTPSTEEPPAPDAFAALEFNSKKAAFGPDALTAPAEAPPPKARPWWSAYWTPDPPPPPDADEAALQWLRFEVLGPVWRERNEKKWGALWDKLKRGIQTDAAVASIGFGNLPGGAWELDAVRRVLKAIPEHSPMPSVPPRRGEELQYANARRLFDFGPPDALYLGIRAGRRALAVKPDDASTYEYVAQSYMSLAQQTREGSHSFPLSLLLRRIQIATALRRALDYNPNLEAAHLLSVQLYLDTGFLDLARDHAEKRLRLFQQSPDPAARRQADEMAKQIAQLGKEITERQTTYELHAAGQPVLGKVKAALQLGLGQTALGVLEKTDWATFKKDDPNKVLGAQKEMGLLLQTGRAEEVGKELIEEEQTLKDGLGVDPETGLPAYEWLRVQVAAGVGDYAEADRWLKALQEKTRRSPRLLMMFQQLGLLGAHAVDVADLEPSALTALLVGDLVLREAPFATGTARLHAPLPSLLDPQSMLLATADAIAEPAERQADLETLRGWLALEAGHTVEARERFKDALLRASPGDLLFRGRPLTQLDLEWLDAAK